MSASNLATVLAPPPGPAVAPQRRTGDARPAKDAEAFSAALDETNDPATKAPAAAPKPLRAANDSSDDVVEAKTDDDPPPAEAEAVAPAPVAQATPPVVLAPLPQPSTTSPSTAAAAEVAAPLVAPTLAAPLPTQTPAAEEDVKAAKADTAADAAQALTLAQAQSEKQTQAAQPTPAPVAAPVVAPPAAKFAPTPISAAPADDAEVAVTTTSTDAPPVAAQPAGRVRDVIERASAKTPAPTTPTIQPEAAPQAQGSGKDTETAPATSPVEPALVKPAAAEAAAPLAALADSPASTPPLAAPTPELRAAQTVAGSPVLSTLSHAAIDATAQIAAQIVKKLEGRSTRFEMALTPDDLGRIDVSLDIDADGQLAARLAFDNPLAAADLRSRVDELRRQLQDAGFTVADDALTFAQRDPAAGQGNAFDRGAERGASRAFGSASRLATDAGTLAVPPRWISLTLTPDRVDLKV